MQIFLLVVGVVGHLQLARVGGVQGGGPGGWGRGFKVAVAAY